MQTFQKQREGKNKKWRDLILLRRAWLSGL
jgi:hypothetical protein